MLVHESQVQETDHPVFDGVKIKVLLSRADHDSAATVVLTRVPAGVEVPEHVHDQSDMS